MSPIIHATPGEIVTPDELRAVAADGTKLRYALMELAAKIPDAITLGRGDPIGSPRRADATSVA